MSPKDEKLKANIKELMEKAKAKSFLFDYPDQVGIRAPEGAEMINPGPGPRAYEKFEPLDVPGDSWADDLVHNRR